MRNDRGGDVLWVYMIEGYAHVIGNVVSTQNVALRNEGQCDGSAGHVVCLSPSLTA